MADPPSYLGGPLSNGQVPQASDWNGFFAAKMDAPLVTVLAVSTTLTLPGTYGVTTTGITVTLPAPNAAPFVTGGAITIKDLTFAANPNIIIAGTIDNGSGATMTNAGESLTFHPCASPLTWVSV